MKRAVILHGTDSGPDKGWFPWLKLQLESKGFEVWVPQLPHAEQPDAKRYNAFLLGEGWDFNDNLIIGHSSGAVELLALLQDLPSGTKIKTGVVISAFTEEITKDASWQRLQGLFSEPFNFAKIKASAETILFVHGSDDPWCPIDWAKYLSQQTGSELVAVEGGQHFSYNLDPAYMKFPKLMEILADRQLL